MRLIPQSPLFPLAIGGFFHFSIPPDRLQEWKAGFMMDGQTF
jgi:hypothetical protein